MKNIIIVTLILCANACIFHVSQFTNLVDNSTEIHDSSIGNGHAPGFTVQESKQLVQEEFPEEEPYPEEEELEPPEEPYIPEEEPYLPEEDPNLPEQPYVPEEEPLLPQEDPNLPEQPFEQTPESW